MACFVNLHKVVVKRSAFSTFPTARNEGELNGGAKSEKFKCQFLQVEGVLDLQKIPTLVPIQKKNTKKKKGDYDERRK
jgi:hypothetical protein